MIFAPFISLDLFVSNIILVYIEIFFNLLLHLCCDAFIMNLSTAWEELLMSLMGLDVGTTGCKASLFDEEGTLLADAYKEYAMEQPAQGYYELDPQLVWKSVRQVITSVMKSVPDGQAREVKALAVSSLGEAVVPVDANGQVLANAILYMDRRGREQAAFLERTIGRERTMEITGVPLHPMFSLPKAMWIKQNQPDVYARTWKFMLFGDFIGYRLTGRSAIDYSLASRTMALNVSDKRWDDSLFAAADIEMSKFPDLVASGEPIGEVRNDIARELGLQTHTLVVAGGHDQACAALGAGVISSHSAIDGIGTVECITPAYSAPALNAKMAESQFNCAPHVVDGLYLTYAFNFTGGSLLRWYRDNFGKAAEAEARKLGVSVYDYLGSAAATSPTDLLVIPHFAGSGTPSMNPEAKGTIHGLTLGTSASELYRALLEGVTYEMRYNAECLKEAGIAIHALKAAGGGSRSDLWLQIKADIMKLPIERLNVGEAGTMGSIILAGIAAGIYRSVQEAVQALVKSVQTFEPGQANVARYDERYERYRKLSMAISSM